MAGGKLSPRQKMIGMMYLVLTALLALNITKEIINAFITIDKGLTHTNINSSARNDAIYAAFVKAKQNDEKKVTPIYNAAMQAQNMSKRLCAYIQFVRGECIDACQGWPTKLNGGTHDKRGDTLRPELIEKTDDFDNPTRIMIGEDPSNVTGYAKDLKKKLKDYHDSLLLILKDDSRARLKSKLDPLLSPDVYSEENEKMISWEWYNFEHAPIVAACAQLTRIQNDVKNAEGDVINELFNSISANDFKFDQLVAKVVAPTSYVLTGEKYTADVFVAAYNSTSDPQIWLCNYDSVTKKPIGAIDSTSVKPSMGLGKYEVTASAVGLQKWSGLIRVKKPDNTFDVFPFRSEYIVAAPSAAVFLEKMNVFYIGVDNPITVSAAGVAPGDVHPTLTGGTLSPNGKPGSYIVRVSSGTEATMSVNATLNGGSKSMGTFKFRIKRVPDPVAYFAGIKGDGILSKAELNAQAGVFAKMENFDFDLKFDVVSYVMSMSINGFFKDMKASGPSLSAEMKSALANAKAGNRIFFQEFTVKGPDGSLRKIPGIAIKVK